MFMGIMFLRVKFINMIVNAIAMIVIMIYLVLQIMIIFVNMMTYLADKWRLGSVIMKMEEVDIIHVGVI